MNSSLFTLFSVSKRSVSLPAALLITAACLGFLPSGCNRAAAPQNSAVAFADVETKTLEPTPAPTPILAPDEGTWASVSRKTIRQHFPAVGSFRARQITNLGPQITGRILAISVDIGDKVKKGQELIRIDPIFFEIEVSQRKAQIESAEVTLAHAELEYKRMKALWETPKGQTPSVSQKLFDDARTQYSIASSQLKIAQEGLKLAEEYLRETVIRAPYDGVITQRLVHLGELVTSAPTTKMLEIQEVGVLELEFSLPQNMLSQVQKGTLVEFEVDGIPESKDQARIAIVYPDLDITTRTFRCRVLVDNPTMKYRPGLLVQVRVIVREISDALCVPIQALKETSSGWQVKVLEASKPVPRSIEIGMQTDGQAEILKGIQENDQIFIPKAIQ